METRKTHDDTYGTLEYITIMDVFDYATLGHIVPDRYLEQLTKYVTDNVPEFIMQDNMIHTTFRGTVYKRPVPMYSWEHYGQVALRCLEWALSNPEKIARA